MKYDVHLFTLVRVKAVGIEADSPLEAVKKAIDQVDLYKLLGHESPAPGIACTEYAEEIMEALVDEAGGRDYSNSQCYRINGEAIDIYVHNFDTK